MEDYSWKRLMGGGPVAENRQGNWFTDLLIGNMNKPHPITQMMPSGFDVAKTVADSGYNLLDTTRQAAHGRMYGAEDAGRITNDVMNTIPLGGLAAKPVAGAVGSGVKGKLPTPPPVDRTGWTVKTIAEHPFGGGAREVSIYDAQGNWKGMRTKAVGTDEQILAQWDQPNTPVKKQPQRSAQLEIKDTPTHAPEVSWRSRDLQDSGTVSPQSILKDYGRGRGAVRQGYVNLSGLPKEKLAGGKTGYDWSELQHSRSAPPPIKIRINPNGSTTILDGNHRISHWRENGFDEAPAWIIDERAKKDIVSANPATGSLSAILSAALGGE